MKNIVDVDTVKAGSGGSTQTHQRFSRPRPVWPVEAVVGQERVELLPFLELRAKLTTAEHPFELEGFKRVSRTQIASNDNGIQEPR